MSEPDQSPQSAAAGEPPEHLDEAGRGSALLAFDWAEGLRGPKKANGLPRPLRLGETALVDEAVLLLSEEELADDAAPPMDALEEPILLEESELLIPLDENGEEPR